MTYKESICVSCANLIASERAYCTNNGKRNLISECPYGGRNAGNRKQCKDFKQAKEKTVAVRLRLLDAKHDAGGIRNVQSKKHF